MNLTHETERALVGCVLVGGPVVFAEVRSEIQSDALLNSQARSVFEAVCAVVDQGRPFTAMEFAAAADQAGQLHEVGGLAGLDDLRSCSRHDELPELIRYVRDAARLRTIGAQAARLGATANHPVAIAEPERYLSAISALADRARGSVAAKPYTAAEGCQAAIDDILTRAKAVVAAKPGIAALEKILNPGFKPRKTYVFGARPGCGKTAIMSQFMGVAGAAGHPQLAFSCEMPLSDLFARIAIQRTRIDAERYEVGVGKDGLSESEFRTILAELSYVKTFPLFTYDDQYELTAMLAKTRVWLDTTARPMIAAHESGRDEDGRKTRLVPMVWMDYFQRIWLDGKFGSQEERLATMSQRIANFARDEGCAIAVLAQANKDNVKEGRAPRASDLKYCDALCADADVVILAHRQLGADTKDPSNVPPEERGRLVEEPAMLIVDKHRGGRVGVAWTTWHGPTVRFTDREPTTEGYWTPNDKKAASGRGQKR